MFNFKNSLAAFAGVSLFVFALATSLPLTGRGQVNNPGGPPQFGPRRFYLTNTEHKGNEALSACAEGYHMASIFEIFDPSNLKYDTTLGLTLADSGSGPPAQKDGWIRTGRFEQATGVLGENNCNVWNSDFEFHYGSAVHLSFGDVSFEIRGWNFGGPGGYTSCATSQHVWCVQD
jgi:hypothetical protein